MKLPANGLEGIVIKAHAPLPANADVLMAGLANPFGLDNDNGLPDSIQWMPPGTHTITAKALNGELKTVTVTADAAGAAAIQASFAAMRADALAGKGDEPFFDFNHDDGVASAHPSEFYWAGDHPKDGGIRAKVTWTAAGAAAVKGKDYRRFSPIFLPGAGGTVLPAQGHANMGGLVNRAAFRAIAPVAAKQGANNPAEATPAEAQTKAKNTTMNPQLLAALLAVMAKHGIVLATDAGDAVVLAKAGDLITQLGTERDTARAELTTTKTALDTAVTAHATSVVEAAVAAGRIAPQDEATKAFWLGSLKTNAVAAKAALDALPVNPALAGQVVQAKGAVVTGSPANNGEHAFIVAAKAHGLAKGITDADEALADYAAMNPQAYSDWTKATFAKEGK